MLFRRSDKMIRRSTIVCSTVWPQLIMLISIKFTRDRAEIGKNSHAAPFEIQIATPVRHAFLYPTNDVTFSIK
jgi:hypothetical protein